MSSNAERMSRALAEPYPHLLGGDADAFGFALDRATFLNGDVVTFTPGSVTAVVGGNNVGKSTFLTELVNRIAHQSGQPYQPTKIVGSIETTKLGEQRDAAAWLARHATFVGGAQNPGFQRPQAGMNHVINLVSPWGSAAPEAGPLHQFLCFYGNAQGRFGMSGSAELREGHADPPTHPVHALQDDRALREELNRAANEIFRTDLVLDNLGRVLRLRVGSLSVPPPPIDDIPQEYRDAMSALPMLDEQGDGMRSLLGLLLPLITASFPLIVIDEPEAFLHPPQAHALGRQLGALAASKSVQVIVATHDKDFLAGLLESGAPVSVVRLARDGSEVRASQLSQDKVTELWADPVLRYTNVLDGLFHRLVVLAEAERDCSYLSAALDVGNRSRDADLDLARNEVLFLPTGGKDGMPKVASALSAVKVAVVAAPDLDVLSDKAKLVLLVESLGGHWTGEIDKTFEEATRDLRRQHEGVKVGTILDALTALLEPRRDENYSAELKELVRTQTRSGSSPWSDVKEYGLAAFKGSAGAAVRELVPLLDAQGVVMVTEGELEQLAPEVAARKGPGWLPAVLEANAQANRLTQEHIERLLKAGVTRSEAIGPSTAPA